MATDVGVLDREMYSEAEAARLLDVSQSTLHYWLEGGERRGIDYEPILRRARSGRRVVTWGEFVEAAFLRRYRMKNIPMAELRGFITILRDKMGIPYPLASQRPWAGERRLVVEAQSSADLPGENWLYAPVDNQLLLLPAGQAFLDRVEFIDGSAARWRPHADPASPVVIDPDQRFGRPCVEGISTSVIREYSTDKYAPEEIAEEFSISVKGVEWAIAYELSA